MKFIHAFVILFGLTLNCGAVTPSALVATPSTRNAVAVGQLASTTHPIPAENAKDYIAGIELAFARINARGGVKGRPLRLVTADDNFDASRATGLVDELVSQQDIVAMVGNFGTQPVLKLAAEGTLEKHQLASIGPMAGLQDALTKPNVFAVRATYEDEVLAMMQHAARLGRIKVGFVYFEAGAGKHLAKLAPEMAQQAGVDLRGLHMFAVTPDKSRQEDTVLQAIAPLVSQDLNAVILIAAGGVHSDAIKAIRKKLGAGLPIYSLGQNSAELLVKDVGAVTAAGVMLTQVVPAPGSFDIPLMREFTQDLQKFSVKKSANFMLVEGYIAGRVATEILKRSKTLNRESVLKAANTAGEINVSGYRVQYDANQRKSLHRVELTMIASNGKLIR